MTTKEILAGNLPLLRIIDEATKHEANVLVNVLSKRKEEKRGLKVVSK
jgi:hypothetical protein